MTTDHRKPVIDCCMWNRSSVLLEFTESHGVVFFRKILHPIFLQPETHLYIYCCNFAEIIQFWSALGATVWCNSDSRPTLEVSTWHGKKFLWVRTGRLYREWEKCRTIDKRDFPTRQLFEVKRFLAVAISHDKISLLDLGKRRRGH